MPEVVIKYKSEKAFKALQDLAKLFDMSIGTPTKNETVTAGTYPEKRIPITYAEDPDVTALAGIWKDRDITQEDLRKEAWGSRL